MLPGLEQAGSDTADMVAVEAAVEGRCLGSLAAPTPAVAQSLEDCTAAVVAIVAAGRSWGTLADLVDSDNPAVDSIVLEGLHLGILAKVQAGTDSEAG